MSEVKKYTLAQVKEHNNDKDVWIVIRDKVYNVTKFLSEHPGGEEVILDVAGKDSTKEFDDVGHSDAAIELMANYYIGEIVDVERKTKKSARKPILLGASSVVVVGLGAYLIYRGLKFLKTY